ncbi:MAG: carboxypeptidase-like regulatory domain-containing protein [Acidobacteria bacterium]|nr:carboxypeptidase-like regulatory domain-containing protein [Acidobacteriota bacterium]
MNHPRRVYGIAFQRLEHVIVKRAWLACVCLLFVNVPVLAQIGGNTGLRGTVTDPSAASIPGAKVTVTRVDTGEQRAVSTNSAGDWEARFLSPGPYRVVVEHSGFKTFTHDGITVSTGEMGTVDIQMQVGEVGQTVEGDGRG